MATAWCAARSCARCSATRSTKRSARSSGRSIREGIFNPGKIVDAPPLTSNLRFGAGYAARNPKTFFDFSEYGGIGGAVEMCSGVGACRKKLAGTMCPSYMATREESDSTRGRANVLRLAMTGQLGEAGLGDEGVYRGARSVPRMPRLQGGVSGGRRHGALQERVSGGLLLAPRHAAAGARLGQHAIACRNGAAGSRRCRTGLPRAPIHRFDAASCPPWKRETFARWAAQAPAVGAAQPVTLFNDTFTNHYDPEIGIAAVEVLERGGCQVNVVRPGCCGRPLISQGLLGRPERARGEVDRRACSRSPSAERRFCSASRAASPP